MTFNTQLSETLGAVVEATGKSVVRVEGRRRGASGVVWAPNLVITADHALDTDDEITVADEGAQYKAKVKGRDPTTDVALLEVEGALTPASFDDGARLKVGHVVLLLGRPGETVRASAGIVHAQGHKSWRTPRGGEIDRYLETDAHHAPGFSGGALVGLDGAVLGLSTSGVLRGRGVVIPTPTLKRVIGQLTTHGRVRSSYLGLSLQPLPLPQQVRAATGEEVGLLVASVEKGGPGDQAGISYGDTILHLGDASVRSLEDFYGWLKADHVGETVPVKLFRSGQVETRSITLGARP